MSFVRSTERPLSVVEMRQAYPQLRPSRRYQRHTARNFDGARTIAPLKRSKFEVILEPEEHFRIGNRLKAVLLFGARAARLGGRPEVFPRQRGIAVERVCQHAQD